MSITTSRDSTITSSRRATTKNISTTSARGLTPEEVERNRHDDLNSAQRAELYDRLSRDLHHPIYRHDFNVHYNEFARFNRRFHDLNYPCPPPPPPPNDENTVSLHGTQSISKTKSLGSKSKSKSKSKYMSSYRMQKEQPTKSLKTQILEKASIGEFPEREKLIAAVIRSLIQNGCDPDAIQYAFQNIALRFVVHEETSEFEICLHL